MERTVELTCWIYLAFAVTMIDRFHRHGVPCGRAWCGACGFTERALPGVML